MSGPSQAKAKARQGWPRFRSRAGASSLVANVLMEMPPPSWLVLRAVNCSLWAVGPAVAFNLYATLTPLA